MKKLVLFSVAAAALLFASCSNKSNEGTTNDADTTKVEVVEEVVTPAEESGDVVDTYISKVEEYLPLLEDVKSGDAAAIEKATKLSQEISALVTKPEFQEAMANMSPEKMQKYQDAMQKFADAATAAAK